MLFGSSSGATLDGGSLEGSDALHMARAGEEIEVPFCAIDSNAPPSDRGSERSSESESNGVGSCGESGERVIETLGPSTLEHVSLSDAVLVSTEEGVALELGSGGLPNIFIDMSMPPSSGSLEPDVLVGAAIPEALVSELGLAPRSIPPAFVSGCDQGMVSSDESSCSDLGGLLSSSSDGSAVDRSETSDSEPCGSVVVFSTGSELVNALGIIHGIKSFDPFEKGAEVRDGHAPAPSGIG